MKMSYDRGLAKISNVERIDARKIARAARIANAIARSSTELKFQNALLIWSAPMTPNLLQVGRQAQRGHLAPEDHRAQEDRKNPALLTDAQEVDARGSARAHLGKSTLAEGSVIVNISQILISAKQKCADLMSARRNAIITDVHLVAGWNISKGNDERLLSVKKCLSRRLMVIIKFRIFLLIQSVSTLKSFLIALWEQIINICFEGLELFFVIRSHQLLSILKICKWRFNRSIVPSHRWS